MRRSARYFFIVIINVLVLELLLRLVGFAIANSGSSVPHVFSFLKPAVYILGESTSAEYVGKDSWPAQLRKLAVAENIRTEFVNLAEPGTTTTALVQSFAQQVQSRPPAAVISMMGVNDGPTTWYYDAGILQHPHFFRNLRVVKLISLLFYKMNEASVVSGSEPVQVPPAIVDLLQAKKSKEAQAAITSLLAGKDISYKVAFYKSLVLALGKAYPVKRDRLKEAANEYLFFLRPAVEISAKDQAVAFQIIFWASALKEKDLCYKVLEVLRNELAFHPTGSVLHSLMECLPVSDVQLTAFFKDYAPGLVPPDRGDSIVKKNYQAVYEIVKRENVCWVVMQYPRTDVAKMKEYFTPEQLESGFLKFVSNEQSFYEHEFSELFTDDFARTFGHTTELGNRLLATAAFAALRPVLETPTCRRLNGPCSSCN